VYRRAEDLGCPRPTLRIGPVCDCEVTWIGGDGRDTRFGTLACARPLR
jgi:hypothetical protein